MGLSIDAYELDYNRTNDGIRVSNPMLCLVRVKKRGAHKWSENYNYVIQRRSIGVEDKPRIPVGGYRNNYATS